SLVGGCRLCAPFAAGLGARLAPHTAGLEQVVIASGNVSVCRLTLVLVIPAQAGIQSFQSHGRRPEFILSEVEGPV
ncbi:MAG: hypothetical protein ACREB3_13785, partial [Burkholderiales bacterium]